MILLIVLALVVIFGGLYLFSGILARRNARRLTAISERLIDGDREGARDLATRWDRSDPMNALSRVGIAQAWSLIGDHERVVSVLDTTLLPRGRAGRSLRRTASELRFKALMALGEEDPPLSRSSRAIGPHTPPPPFDPRAMLAMQLASLEADAWGHSHIGTEHLLLGLTAVPRSGAARILRKARLNRQRLRRTTLHLLAERSWSSADHAPGVRAGVVGSPKDRPEVVGPDRDSGIDGGVSGQSPAGDAGSLGGHRPQASADPEPPATP